jgi:FkbM family methyltransferase
LEKAPDVATHFKQLAEELKRGPESKGDLKGFIESFVRPVGLDKPATPIIVETVASVPEIEPQVGFSGVGKVARLFLAPVAAIASFPRKGAEALLSFSTRALRFGLFNIARIQDMDATALVARRTPLDYSKNPISILVTSPKENSTRTRSVMSEPWTVHWLEHVIKPGDVLYDVGASVGTYALVAAISHEGTVRVFAFEPSFVTYAALCRNVLENGCEKSITPMPLVLTEKKGSTLFKYRSLVSGAAQHAFGDRNLFTKGFKERKPVYQQRMVGITLDSLVQDFHFDPPNHIKLDVDGGELQVLRGAAATLKAGTIKSVLVDACDDREAKQVTAFLKQLGFGLASGGGDDAAGFHAIFARDVASVADAMASCKLPARPRPREKAGSPDEQDGVEPIRGNAA